MSRARRRHPALASKIDRITNPTTAPGVRMGVVGSAGLETGPSLNYLVVKIHEAAEGRGHGPFNFIEFSREHGRVSCIKCGMDADAQTSPPANGIDIGGNLVALNCKESS